MPELKEEFLEEKISSGVGSATPGISSLPFFLFKRHINCITWNARAFSHHDHSVRQKMSSFASANNMR